MVVSVCVLGIALGAIGARIWLGPLCQMHDGCSRCGQERSFWSFNQSSTFKCYRFHVRMQQTGDKACAHQYWEAQEWVEYGWLW